MVISYIAATWLSVVSFSMIFLTPFLFVSRMFDVKYYIIRKDDEKTRAISKKLQTQTMNSITIFRHGKFYPGGYFINWKCIGYYNMDVDENHEIHILTTNKYFQNVIEIEKRSVSFTQTQATKSTTPHHLTMYCRSGSYTCSYYNRMNIDICNLEPVGQQINVTNDICNLFYQKKRGVFFIHGISGAGKSTIGFLVANNIKGTFCHTFNPTDPGDTLTSIIHDSNPSDETPLIILIEEVNTMIHAVHQGTIQKHKNITTCIHNKSTYNTFMDDLIFYKNVLILFTSNESKESIDALDPCYLRKGRVDGYYSMMEKIDV